MKHLILFLAVLSLVSADYGYIDYFINSTTCTTPDYQTTVYHLEKCLPMPDYTYLLVSSSSSSLIVSIFTDPQCSTTPINSTSHTLSSCENKTKGITHSSFSSTSSSFSLSYSASSLGIQYFAEGGCSSDSIPYETSFFNPNYCTVVGDGSSFQNSCNATHFSYTYFNNGDCEGSPMGYNTYELSCYGELGYTCFVPTTLLDS